MPGHVKKTEGPDPCPDQWLIVSDELKVKLKSKPYDPKKSCWVPEKATGGYLEGLIESIDGEKATVKLLESGDVRYLLLLILGKGKSLNCFLIQQYNILTNILDKSLQKGSSWTSQSSKV